jgi:hypothetical protein
MTSERHAMRDRSYHVVDYLCCQAVMFGRTSSNLFSQAKLIFIRSRRLG